LTGELGTTAHKLNMFFDGIGIYVKAIPYLQNYLIFRGNKEKSANCLALILDSTGLGRQYAAFIKSPEMVEVKDLMLDKQGANQQARLNQKLS
jgi:hypothetical protein